MQKLDCNSQDAIRNFIEKSGKLVFFKQYYYFLLIENEFKKYLKNIANLISNKKISCFFNTNNKILDNIKNHLKFLGINVYNINDIYVNKEETVYQINVDRKNITFKTDNPLDKHLQKKEEILLVIDKNISLPKGFGTNYVSFQDTDKYYDSFFNLLKLIIPSINIENITKNFKKQHTDLINCINDSNITKSSLNTQTNHSKSILILYKNPIKIFTIFFLIICLFSYFFYSQNLNKGSVNYIRSKLLIPDESVLIKRSKLITAVDNIFDINKGKGITTVILVGLGGTGKTILARLYSKLTNKKLVWEINAENSNGIIRSFEELAENICSNKKSKKKLKAIQTIPNESKRNKNLIIFIKDILRKHKDWFLIFDNVDMFSDISEYFPHDENIWGNGKIIITTRNANIINHGYINKNNIIFVKELDKNLSLDLFNRVIDSKDEKRFYKDDETIEFLKNIPPFPLDISIVACYLKNSGISYSEYLDYMKKDSKTLYKFQSEILKDISNYNRTRYDIITLPLKKLLAKSNDFKKILLLISMVDSQNIPIKLLVSNKDHRTVDNLLYNLKKYSLVLSQQYNKNNSMFSIHRSIQDIIYHYIINSQNMDNNKKIVKSLIEAIISNIDNIIHEENFYKMKLLIYHIEKLLNCDNLLLPITKIQLLNRIAYIYHYLGNNIKAKTILDRCIIDNKGNSIEKARSLMYLGIILRKLGKYQQSRELLEKSLVIYKKNSFINKNDIALVLLHLGVIYRDIGNYKEAEKLIKHSVDINNNNPWSLIYLGDIYKSLGYYNKAEKIYNHGVNKYKNLFPNNEEGIAWISVYLSNIYRELGLYEKAESMLNSSLKTYKKYFPSNHFYINWVLVSLGKLYIKTHSYNKAKKVLIPCLKVYEKHYGTTHIKTAQIIQMLGEIYIMEDNITSAEKILNKSLSIFKKNNHIEIYKTYEILSALLLKKSLKCKNKKTADNLKEQSVSYLKKSLKKIINNFTSDSPHILRIKNKISSKG